MLGGVRPEPLARAGGECAFDSRTGHYPHKTVGGGLYLDGMTTKAEAKSLAELLVCCEHAVQWIHPCVRHDGCDRTIER